MFRFYRAIIGATTAVNIIEAYREDKKRFDALCKSLPEEMANQLKADRQKRMDESEQHRKNLEVAREGRSLNFWGNR